jgi:dienelactone hydrolase
VILFSPGFGASHLLYATFVQELASEGYIVVSIDHPHDATIVELSDGSIAYANISDTTEAITFATSVRVADVRFVLHELTNGTNCKVPGLHEGLDMKHVGFLGHSLGGATVASTMAIDGRIVAGVNMDGAFQAVSEIHQISKPFLIMAATGHNRTTYSTWAEVWPKLKGFKREIELNGTTHLTFTDGPVMSDLLGIKAEDLFGTISGKRFGEIQHAYLTAFFNRALRRRKEKLLDGPSKQFPEVTFAPQV